MNKRELLQKLVKLKIECCNEKCNQLIDIGIFFFKMNTQNGFPLEMSFEECEKKICDLKKDDKLIILSAYQREKTKHYILSGGKNIEKKREENCKELMALYE